MRFLVSVVTERADLATETEMTAIDAFNELLRANGHWVMAAGVEPPEAGTRMDNRGDAPMVSAGRRDELGEYVSGFWIIDATSRDEALHLGAAASRACNRMVEVRAFLG